MRFSGGVVRKKNQNALILFDPYLSKKIMKNSLTKLKRKLDIIQTTTNFKEYFKEILTYYQSRLAIMDARSVFELKALNPPLLSFTLSLQLTSQYTYSIPSTPFVMSLA